MRSHEKLRIESIEVRAVSIPLRRPIVAKIGTFPKWPLILIDVKTKEGITGRSYLESRGFCEVRDMIFGEAQERTSLKPD